MSRKGFVYNFNEFAGTITEQDDGSYSFVYENSYLKSNHAAAISLTLPLRAEPFLSKEIFPFFDGLIPEGWLLRIAVKNWKIKENDRMAILLHACEDCIGAISVFSSLRKGEKK